MEITVRVEDSEGPFLMELLRKFSFVQDVKQNQLSIANQIDLLWQQKASKLFETRRDFDSWLKNPNQAVDKREPIDLLSEDTGYEVITKLLGRLEHGIMA
jgi:putative toxin-antitoxin system antitoxin component (TIGR02293 family)